ncbi:MAG: carbohydrate ABC transporter substrate-binding protein [Erysipelothrix sp.]|nr:carbohydrate ABC transporter substrate-binding protein [Erysipelothrix sp.]
MKKLFTIFVLAFVLVLGACSSANNTPNNDGNNNGNNNGDNNGAEKVVLKITGLDGGYGREHWDELAAKFEAAHEGVTVELELAQNIHEVLRPQIQAGNTPDIIYLSVNSEGGLVDTMVREKQLEDISALYEMTVPNESVTVGEKLLPGFVENLIISPYGDGKSYMAPLFYSPTGLFYNADLVGEGKTYEVPETFEEFLALGQQAAGDGVALVTYPTAGYFDGFIFSILNMAVGPEEFAKLMNYDVEAWQSEDVKDAFIKVGEMLEYVHENTVSQANGNDFVKNQQMVLDNDALFIPNGTWLPGEMADAPRVDGFEWGMTALPALEVGGDRYALSFFEQAYVPTGAKNKDLALEFLAYLYSDEAAQIIYDKGKGAVQPIVGSENLMEGDELNQTFYSIYSDGAKAALGGFAAVESVEGVNIADVLFEQINAVANKTVSAESWYDSVVDAIGTLAEQNQ